MLAAVVQFYFDRFLPTNDSWPEGFDLMIGDDRAQVNARRPPQPLFPETIDQTLSTMELVLAPVSRPGGELRSRVRDRVVDRLQITLIRAEESPPPMGLAEAAMDAIFEITVQLANVVIGHCRVLADSPFLRGVEREYRLQDQRVYVMNPHTVSWFAGQDPEALQPLPVYPGRVNAAASSGAVRAPETGSVSFSDLRKALTIQGSEPQTPPALLVTAEGRLTQMWLRESVVALSAAVEIASDTFIEAHQPSAEVDKILRSRDSFATKRLHRLPTQLAGRSFQTDDPHNFSLVEAAYRARNRVSHQGQLEYRDSGGDIRKLDQHVVRDFLTAARAAVMWLLNTR